MFIRSHYRSFPVPGSSQVAALFCLPIRERSGVTLLISLAVGGSSKLSFRWHSSGGSGHLSLESSCAVVEALCRSALL